jgi:autotransporter-associated beta strand protein
MNVGTKPATAANNVALSTVNLLGGTVVVGASGITCAGSNGTGVETDSTNIVQLNFGGASVTVSNDIVLGTQTSTAGNATLLSTLNITGGTVTVYGDILCGLSGVPVNPAPRLATLALNGPGALLDLKGYTIGGTAGNVTNYLDALNFEEGTLQNVGGINGGAPLVKTGAGLLTLAGSSTYTGGTVVSNGTLVVNADGALGIGSVTVTPGAALTLTNGVSNQYINPKAALYLISGASPVNLGFSASSPNHIAGLYFDGVAQTAGTYGSTSSTATYQDNIHFAGTGVLVVTVPVAGVTLTTSPNPSAAGQPVVFTATVTGTSGTPTGTIAFLNGANVVDSALLNGSGIASITNSTLLAGTDALTAAYGGSLTYTPATSSAIAQTVNSLPPHIGPVSLNGTNVMVQLGSTAIGTSYVLQVATNLAAPIIWLPVQTNAGTGGTITNLVPVNLSIPMEFFQYQLQ